MATRLLSAPAVLVLARMCLLPLPAPAREQAARPRIGLVLGGGGAKGAANAGVAAGDRGHETTSLYLGTSFGTSYRGSP